MATHPALTDDMMEYMVESLYEYIRNH